MITIPELDLLDLPSAGDVVAGKYRLSRPLGEGGMGRVWLAHNDALDKDVAIKFLRTEIASPEASLRFAQEARMTACIEHPAVVRVFDVGESQGGQPFIVMERLEGQTLAELLEASGRLRAIDAVRILLPIVDGLTKVHALGIVHRDIKPENVFLAREAGRIQPKLLDFGIARLESLIERIDPRLTCSGAVLGSPGYMSPEQARGEGDVDCRADVWGMCIVIYEAIQGSCPFSGDNYNAMLRSILEHPILPIPESPDAAGIWPILQRGLAKDPEARTSTMQELGRTLASWLVTHGVSTDIHGSGLDETWSLGRGRLRRTTLELVDENALPSLGLPGRRAGEPLEVTANADSPRDIPPAPVSRVRERVFWVPVGLASVAVVAPLVLAFAVQSTAFTGTAQAANDRAAATAPADPRRQQAAARDREGAMHGAASTPSLALSHLPGAEGGGNAAPLAAESIAAQTDDARPLQRAQARVRVTPPPSRSGRAGPEDLGLKEAY